MKLLLNAYLKLLNLQMDQHDLLNYLKEGKEFNLFLLHLKMLNLVVSKKIVVSSKEKKENLLAKKDRTNYIAYIIAIKSLILSKVVVIIKGVKSSIEIIILLK